MKKTYLYKHIHIFPESEPKFETVFYRQIISLNLYKDKDFLIVVQFRHDNIENESTRFTNIKYVPQKEKIIKHYLREAEYVFLHSINRYDNPIFFRKKLLKRIIWRSWGGALFPNDYYYPNNLKLFDRFHRPSYYFNYFRLFFKSRYDHYRQKIFIKNIKAIGIANIVDKLSINSVTNNDKFFRMNYWNMTQFEFVKPSPCPNFLNDSNKIKIMIGHSGYQDENHVKIIKMLTSFEQFYHSTIIVPLSYGDSNYIKTVMKTFSNIPNIYFITNQYNRNEWNWILKTIDVAVFDSKFSTGLGNISILTKLKKTLYLNNEGLIAKGFECEKIPYYSTSEITPSIFLKNHLLFYKADGSSLCISTEEDVKKEYIRLFNFLETDY